jgi:hypothetical protein
MGHMVLVVVDNVRGDKYAAKAATRAAIDCDADPMYMLFAEASAAGLAIGSSSAEEARRCLDQVETRWRNLGGDLFGGILGVFRHALEVLEGHTSQGMAGLTEERQRQEVLGNIEGVRAIDSFTAGMRSLIATEHVAALPSPAALRDRAFLSRQRVGAAKKARGALEQLAKSLDECGNNGDRAGVEFELATLAKHERQVDDARAHLQTVLQLLADAPDASLCLRARGMLAELGATGS